MSNKNNFESSDEEVIVNKKNKIESDVEEGEVSSDDDDVTDFEKYIKNNDDRTRLLNMTEKEREEEIFKRAQELNDLKSRKKAARKLNEQKKKDQNNRQSKRIFSEIFHSGDESDSSSLSADSTPTIKKSKTSNIGDRQKTLDSHKKSKIDALSHLNKLVQKRKEKIDKINKEEALKKNSESDMSDIEDKKFTNVNQTAILSSSDSDHFDEPEANEEDKLVDSVEDLSKIRLTRHRLEKWVHMPYFRNLVKGCFVRVNIGEGPEVAPVYRIAEIIDSLETVKIYDLGSTRTNAGLQLRVGKSITMFRLLFVSNQSFLLNEFDSWKRRVIADGFSLPKMSFVEQKAKEIMKYSNYSINDEVMFKKILESKKRFLKNPVNYPVKKAELGRLKQAAEDEGDEERASKYQEEIDELNFHMEKLERKRTEGIKNISYINQRNRENTEKDIEKALELERAENLEWEKKGGDPFVREATKPVLNHRKKKKQTNDKDPKEEPKPVNEEPDVSDNKQEIIESKININNIHDFELNLDIVTENENRIQKVESTDNTFDVTGSIMKAINNSIGNISANSSQTSNNRRVLNLSDYKRRKGLI